VEEEAIEMRMLLAACALGAVFSQLNAAPAEAETAARVENRGGTVIAGWSVEQTNRMIADECAAGARSRARQLSRRSEGDRLTVAQ
jgi:hypothetical protein